MIFDILHELDKMFKEAMGHALVTCFGDTEDRTMKELCEVIAEEEIITKPDGTHPTAREIFEYSPGGELSAIPQWFVIAAAKREKRGER